jgi:hypothetical protein
LLAVKRILEAIYEQDFLHCSYGYRPNVGPLNANDPPSPPYTEIIHITPALTATLPGQINPFAYNLILGKASALIGPIAKPGNRLSPHLPILLPG